MKMYVYDRIQTMPNSRNVSADDAMTGYPDGSIQGHFALLVES
jgi:hypothetical protein